MHLYDPSQHKQKKSINKTIIFVVLILQDDVVSYFFKKSSSKYLKLPLYLSIILRDAIVELKDLLLNANNVKMN